MSPSREVGYIPFDPEAANLHHAEILGLKGDSYRLQGKEDRA